MTSFSKEKIKTTKERLTPAQKKQCDKLYAAGIPPLEIALRVGLGEKGKAKVERYLGNQVMNNKIPLVQPKYLIVPLRSLPDCMQGTVGEPSTPWVKCEPIANGQAGELRLIPFDASVIATERLTDTAPLTPASPETDAGSSATASPEDGDEGAREEDLQASASDEDSLHDHSI